MLWLSGPITELETLPKNAQAVAIRGRTIERTPTNQYDMSDLSPLDRLHALRLPDDLSVSVSEASDPHTGIPVNTPA